MRKISMNFVYANGNCFRDFKRNILGKEGKIDGIYDRNLVKQGISQFGG